MIAEYCHICGDGIDQSDLDSVEDLSGECISCGFHACNEHMDESGECDNCA